MGSADRAAMSKKRKWQRQWDVTGARKWIPDEVVRSKAYESCSPVARSVLLELVFQTWYDTKTRTITNNGDLTTAEEVIGGRGIGTPKTIRKAVAELEAAGLIVQTRHGGLHRGCNLYALTWLPLNEQAKLEIDQRCYPYRAYLAYGRPVPPEK